GPAAMKSDGRYDGAGAACEPGHLADRSAVAQIKVAVNAIEAGADFDDGEIRRGFDCPVDGIVVDPAIEIARQAVEQDVVARNRDRRLTRGELPQRRGGRVDQFAAVGPSVE